MTNSSPRPTSFAAALIFALSWAAATGTPAAAAPTADEIAARFAVLGIQSSGKPATAANLGDIQMVSLYGDKAKQLVDGDCALFAALPNLRQVSFTNARIGKACLEALAGAPGLTTVTLSTSEVEAGAIAALATAPAIDSLSFSDVKGLAPADIGALAPLRRLRFFSVGFTMIPVGRTPWHDDRMLAEIAKLTSVQTMTVSRIAAGPGGMAKIAAMPALRELTLSYGLFGDAAVAPLAGAKLTSLNINQNYRLGPATVASVAKISTLTYLDLSNTGVGGGLAPLAGLAQLNSLTLGASFVTDVDLKALAGLPALATLNAYDNPAVGDAGAIALTGLKSLRTVSLGRTAITDAGLTALLEMPALQSVFVPENAFTDAFTPAAAKSRATNIDVSGSDLDDAGLAALAKVSTLTSLSVRQTRVTDAGVAAAKAARTNLGIYK
jgi:hypothetical protein